MAQLRALGAPAAQMAAGMMVFAASGYAFLVLAGRALPKDQATLATSVYFLVNVVGPGIFFALEQVASRTTAAALATGGDLGTVARRAYRSSLRLLAAVMVGLGALAPVLGGKTLHGDWPLYVVMLAMPVVSVHLHLGRGRLAGMRRFGSYAATLAVEGGGRAALCLTVAAVGADSAVQFGLAYVIPSALAAGWALLAAHRAARRAHALGPAALPPAGEAPTGAVMRNTASAGLAPGVGGLGRGMAALAVAGLFSQLLPNIAALAVNSRLPAASAAALAFSQAAVMARIPLLLFVPFQAMILPRLSAAAARGDLAAVRTKASHLLPVTTGAGLAGALAFVLLGSWALRTFFGTSEPVPGGVLLMLALSTVVLMAAFTLQPALVAVGGDAAIMAGWAAGSVVTGTIALLPFPSIPAAATGQLLGPALTVALLGGALVIQLRRPPRPVAAAVPAGRGARIAS
jgi:O-antigen/teichoic acid export membrane protein